MHAACARRWAARRPVPAGRDFAFPLDARAGARSRRARASSTSTIRTTPPASRSPEAIHRDARRRHADALVFVDEAYHDFTGENFLGELAQRDPTSSSAARSRRRIGLAGMRVGALIGARILIAGRRAMPPYSLNVVAVAALGRRSATGVLDVVSRPGRASQARLRACDRLGLRYWPSAANFVLVDGGDAPRDRRGAARTRHLRPRSHDASRAARAASASPPASSSTPRRSRPWRRSCAPRGDRSHDRNADPLSSNARRPRALRRHTGIRFLDHMLELVARHGAFDLKIARPATSTSISTTPSRTSASRSARRCRRRSATARGINRAGYFVMPMDETLAVAAIDLGGRPHAVVDLKVKVRAGRRSADRAGARFLRGLRHRRARQRPPQGAVRPLEPSPDRGGVQGVRARAARGVREGQAAREHAAEHQGPAVNIALIDYGAGNLTSVRKALAAVGAEVYPPDRPSRSGARRHRRARRRPLRRHGGARRHVARGAIRAHGPAVPAARHLPRHAVAVRGQRRGARRPGLGVSARPPARTPAATAVRRATPPLKVPHVGWNTLNRTRPSSIRRQASGAQAYFTHSYAAPVTKRRRRRPTHGEPFARRRRARPRLRRAVPSGEIRRRRASAILVRSP